MKHQTYEDWLFTYYGDTTEMMSSERVSALQEHLQSCESCRQMANAWELVEMQLSAKPMLEPKPGFTNRWQAHLRADRNRMHQRQTASVLIFSSVSIAILIAVLLTLVWPWMRSPNVFLWTWLYRTFTIYAYAGVVGDIMGTLFQTATGVIPLTWWVVFVGLISELGVLWIVSYRLLTNPRRIKR